jgi:hypothetical protein
VPRSGTRQYSRVTLLTHGLMIELAPLTTDMSVHGRYGIKAITRQKCSCCLPTLMSLRLFYKFYAALFLR